jgi:hypothetical protein
MRAHEFISEATIGQQAAQRAQTRTQQAAKQGITGRKGATGSNALSFKGYKCTKDCSGHRAGYEWAKRKGVATPKQMPLTNSNSFWEGGVSYAQGR